MSINNNKCPYGLCDGSGLIYNDDVITEVNMGNLIDNPVLLGTLCQCVINKHEESRK